MRRIVRFSTEKDGLFGEPQLPMTRLQEGKARRASHLALKQTPRRSEEKAKGAPSNKSGAEKPGREGFVPLSQPGLMSMGVKKAEGSSIAVSQYRQRQNTAGRPFEISSFCEINPARAAAIGLAFGKRVGSSEWSPRDRKTAERCVSCRLFCSMTTASGSSRGLL